MEVGQVALAVKREMNTHAQLNLFFFYTVQSPRSTNVPFLFRVDLPGSTNLFKITPLKACSKYLEKKISSVTQFPHLTNMT